VLLYNVGERGSTGKAFAPLRAVAPADPSRSHGFVPQGPVLPFDHSAVNRWQSAGCS
jgi:hypothetical protein